MKDHIRSFFTGEHYPEGLDRTLNRIAAILWIPWFIALLVSIL